RLPGHVADAAVAVLGEDGELLALIALQDAIARHDTQLDDVRRVGRRGRRARRDPATEELIFIAIPRHALAAAVRYLRRRLEPEKVGTRGGREHAAAACLLGEGLVVKARIEAE